MAAIDCGSLSTRLLIARQDGSALVRIMRITGLARGVDSRGRLDREGVERALRALEEYRRVMDAHGVGVATMIGTSALRDSADRESFAAQASAIVGVELRLLEGESEAALSFRGACSGLPAGEGPWLMVDIGGGSTELAVGAGLGEAISLDVGCVRVTERFLHSDPPSRDEIGRAGEWLAGLLADAVRQVPGLRSARSMVGLAGTVSALASWVQGLRQYRRDLVHHYRLSERDIARALEELSQLPTERRAGLAGIEPQRAPYIVGGTLVLAAVMEHFGLEQCLVSEADILDGLVAELANSGTAAQRR